MDELQRKRADVLASANLIFFCEDKDGNYFAGDKVVDFMRDCDIDLQEIEKIQSEKIGVIHRLELEDFIDCMQFGEDSLRAIAIVNGFNVVIHIEEGAIPLIIGSLEALGKRFFSFGASMKYIWCGFNTAVDDHKMIHDFLVEVYPLHGEEMFNGALNL